jgi:hypothetical protein
LKEVEPSMRRTDQHAAAKQHSDQRRVRQDPAVTPGGRLAARSRPRRVMTGVPLDAAGRRRSPARCRASTPAAQQGVQYPADPPRVEETLAVMRTTSDGPHGRRLPPFVVVLWRAGLRIHEGLALSEADLDGRPGLAAQEAAGAARGAERPLRRPARADRRAAPRAHRSSRRRHQPALRSRSRRRSPHWPPPWTCCAPSPASSAAPLKF